MPRSFARNILCILVIAAGVPAIAAASNAPERFQMNRDIRIEQGERAGDISCLNCSVYIRGEVAGDVFALHGNIVVETGGSVSGDMSTLIGNIRVASGGSVAGEVAAIAGGVRRDPQSTIAGDVASMEGTQWLLLVVLTPLVMIAVVVAFIIWLVQRSRRPATASA
jgi:cytoskeletal protein CcmA (bactofilin family)